MKSCSFQVLAILLRNIFEFAVYGIGPMREGGKRGVKSLSASVEKNRFLRKRRKDAKKLLRTRQCFASLRETPTSTQGALV